MASMLACPQCKQKPEWELIDTQYGKRFMAQCEKCAHMALGKTQDEMVQHWNRMVQGLITTAPDYLQHQGYMTPQARAIYNALFSIDKNEGGL